ncbi:MAG: hypothetical protein ABL931_01510 [Usitatibacteraceae bacterium]
MTQPSKRFSIAIVLASAILLALPAEATVTAYFASGPTCKGAPTTAFAARESVQVSLCVTTTVEALCGATVRLEVDKSGDSGHFQVTGRTLGPNYPDPNNETLPPSISIDSAKLSRLDFGGTRDKPLPPAADQLIVTFTLAAQAAAKNPSYSIRLSENSVVSVGKSGSCDPTVALPISANLALTRK